MRGGVDGVQEKHITFEEQRRGPDHRRYFSSAPS